MRKRKDLEELKFEEGVEFVDGEEFDEAYVGYCKRADDGGLANHKKIKAKEFKFK